MVWCDLFFFRGVMVLAGRAREACLAGKAPAPEALFSMRQGGRSLLGGEGSCPGSSIHNPAGCEKPAGRGRLLPRKRYSQSGRVGEACLAGKAPAPEALFSMRQGENSLLGRGGSCPGSAIHNPAGWEKLVWRGRHLPKKLYSRSGRVRIACLAGKAPAPEALFSIRQGARSLPGGNGSCPRSSIHDPAG